MVDGGGIRFGGLIKAGVLFSILLTLYLGLSSFQLLSNTRSYLEQEMAKRLLDLSEIISDDIKGNYDEVTNDPYYLSAISIKESLVSLSLMDKDGLIVMEASGNSRRGLPPVRMGITKEQFAGVWLGKPVVSPLYYSEDRTLRSVYFPVKDGTGRVLAAGEATLDAGYIENLTQLGTTYFFLKSLIILFLTIVLIYVLKVFFGSQKRLAQAARGAGQADVVSTAAGDNTSFVVNTFHSMVTSLKEKEKELKELKDKAEEKARYIESYNEDVLKSISSGVMTFDREGRVVTANQAAVHILQLDPDSVQGTGMEGIFGDSWICVLVRHTIEAGRPEGRSEGPVRAKDGGLKWLGAGVSPLMAGDGGLSGAILVFTDLTEVRDLKDRMELKERLTVLGEMSAGIAHELRNPMAVISGYAKLLTKEVGDNGPGRDAVESIQAEITVMDEIIREFMNFTQPTELNIVRVDMGALLEESMKALSGSGEGVKRELSVEPGLPEFDGDAVLLRQAFVNIIKNAMESMENGGSLRVAARMADTAEEGVNLSSAACIKVDVVDTGCGMSKENISRIFTPFFTTKGKGTGLGLALVQKIIVYHGGRAAVKSVEGQGTTFTVYLPAGPPERTS